MLRPEVPRSHTCLSHRGEPDTPPQNTNSNRRCSGSGWSHRVKNGSGLGNARPGSQLHGLAKGTVPEILRRGAGARGQEGGGQTCGYQVPVGPM